VRARNAYNESGVTKTTYEFIIRKEVKRNVYNPVCRQTHFTVKEFRRANMVSSS